MKLRLHSHSGSKWPKSDYFNGSVNSVDLIPSDLFDSDSYVHMWFQIRYRSDFFLNVTSLRTGLQPASEFNATFTSPYIHPRSRFALTVRRQKSQTQAFLVNDPTTPHPHTALQRSSSHSVSSFFSCWSFDSTFTCFSICSLASRFSLTGVKFWKAARTAASQNLYSEIWIAH